jgi:hypothetical protein
MKVVRALLAGVVVIALSAACGSDGNGSASSGSPLSKCASGSTASNDCQSCEQSKCSSELHKCYGSDFNGGACKALVKCANAAKDPCNSDCTPDSSCESCISDDLVPCLQKNCASECGIQTPTSDGGSAVKKGTCADLGPCCEGITNASAKSGCQNLVKDGNDTNCESYYASLRFFCEEKK